MSKAIARMFVYLVPIALLATGLVTSAFAQGPLQPNSIQVSRVQYDGNSPTYTTIFYTSPYLFPEIFNDPAGLTTGNEIQDIAGIQGSIYIDQFSSVPTTPSANTLPLPSNGPPAAYPTVEPGSYITTSFSSKSEGALMLSVDGSYLTYMGYEGADQVDNVSNSYSPNPNYDLFPNSYTADPAVGSPISITAASDTSKGVATITLSSAVTVPSGAYFTIAGMSTSGYNGTFATPAAASNSTTLTLTGLPGSLASCSSSTTACGGTATYDPPYPLYDREVALINSSGLVNLTPIDNTNSGDNPRAAITVDGSEFYIVGNSDSTTATPSTGPNNPGLTIGSRCGAPLNNVSYQFGTYLATDRPDESAKKHIKDNNWRGVGIYTDGNGNQQLYVSKGSGGNGDDGLFQVGTSLPGCSAMSIAGFGTNGNAGMTITELPGLAFPVTNQTTQAATPILPFGFWFANPTTLYVADEGNPPSYTGGSSPSFSNSTNGTYVPSSDSYAGLEKWSLIGGTWTLDYTIQAGLNFNQPQTFAGYNDIDGNPIESYTYGLRNMTGQVNGDGTVTIYAITAQFSAVSGGESDPTSLVGITDTLSATSLPANEQFVTLQTSGFQEVYRGVAYIPPAPGAQRQTQTINFPNPGPLTYGAGPITLAATATSGWPIAYTLVSGPATLLGNGRTSTGAGSVVVQADQSGNTDYTAAASVQDTIIVNREATSVTWLTPAPIPYGTPLSATQLDATASVAGNFSYTPPATTVLNAGTQILSVTFTPSGSNYATSTGSVMLVVNPTPTTVVWSNPTAITYGTALSATQLDASATPVNAGSFVYTPAVGAVLNAGSNPLSVTFTPSNTNYAASTGGATLQVNPAGQSISFTTPAPATAVYNTSFTVAASSSSGLAINYTSSGSCTNSGATYTITSGSGTCKVIASQPGNSNYLAAVPRSESTAVLSATPTVTFTGAPATAQYGSMFTLVATTNSTASVIITATNPSTCALSGSSSPATVTILKGSGTCKFTASWPADADYSFATLSQTTAATRLASVITWATPAPITYGMALGSAQLDATASTAGNFTYSPAVGRIESVGTSTLKVTFTPSSTNYTTTSDTVMLQVVAQPTTTSITSASSTTVTMNRNGVATSIVDFSVAGYKPTGAVSLVASTGEVCSGSVSAATGDGSCKLTFTTTGPRTITATYEGDLNHTGSNSDTETVTVTVNPF